MRLAADYACPVHGLVLFDDGHDIARTGEGKRRPMGHKRPVRHWHCPVHGHTVDVAAAVYLPAARKRRPRAVPLLVARRAKTRVEERCVPAI